MMGAKISFWFQFILCKFLCIQICSCQTFDQVYTGISFTPYVKNPINRSDKYPPWSGYTRKEIQVMLEVILQKFSRVVTWGAGSKNSSYIWNVTYHNDSLAYVYTAEIAAKINRQLGRKRITILQGAWYENESTQSESEIQLAIECTEKANQIYPGTVEGIVLSTKKLESNFERAQQTQMYLRRLRNSSVGALKLGTWMYCNRILTDYKGDSVSSKQQETLVNILQNSDFVICKTDSLAHVTMKGDEDVIHSVFDNLLEYRTQLRKYKANLEVMGRIKWASSENQKWESIESLKVHWNNVGLWAEQNRIPIWFYEAFDNPWINNCGWWRLSDNSKSNQTDGYIEKISVLEYEAPKIKLSTIIYANLVIGTSVLLILAAVIVIRANRSKKQEKISNEDVREFKEGMSQETLLQPDDNSVEIPGQKFPYDSSIEIDKSQLKIDARKILGTGHFGRVYKGLIKRHGQEDEHVALKVSKQNCSRSTLKDLLSEIKVMSYIGVHRNIVALKGVYTAELHDGKVYIATELCSLGSLQSYLRRNEKISRYNTTCTNESKEAASGHNRYDEPISLQEMLTWCHEIACGMEYLGTKNVVHADLATRNVLLSSEKVAKVSDFGLSRRMYNYTNYVKSQKVPLPWRWMAIESLKWGEFSAKSDVWSYGITLWEIFSFGEMPFSGLVWTPSFVKMLVDGTRLESPSLTPPEIYRLMTDCWKKKPDDRPDFTKICEIVSDIKASKKNLQ